MNSDKIDKLAKLMLNELNGILEHQKLDYIKRRLEQAYKIGKEEK